MLAKNQKVILYNYLLQYYFIAGKLIADSIHNSDFKGQMMRQWLCILTLASSGYIPMLQATKIILSTQKYRMNNGVQDSYINVTIENRGIENTLNFWEDGIYKDNEKLDLSDKKTINLLKLKTAIAHHIDDYLAQQIWYVYAKDIRYHLEYEFVNHTISCKKISISTEHSWLTKLKHIFCQKQSPSFASYLNTDYLYTKLKTLVTYAEKLQSNT